MSTRDTTAPDVHLLYITAKDKGEAERIGRTLLAERLVACVNIVPSVTSLYWWEEKIQSETECLLIAKTRGELVDRVIARILALHSYDCPCVVSLPIAGGNPAFLAWISRETSDQS